MTVATEPTSHTFEEASAVSAETFTESHDGIPTIELSDDSSAAFQLETIEISNIHQQEELDATTTAITVAELVADSVKEDTDLEAGRRRSPGIYSSGKRPEFVSATFIKPTADTPLGFNLHSRDTKIASISPGSLASSSPLQVGDRVYSINKKRCSDMSSQAIADHVAELVGRVQVVCHNKGGSASFTESMVTKANPWERSGLVLKRVGRNSQLLVSNIRDDKVFTDSLLNIGDEVLTINGISCQHLSPVEAANIIKQTPKDVTVVARSLLETGVVVAELGDDDIGIPYSHRSDRLQQDLNRRRRAGGQHVSRERAACAVFGVVGIIVVIAFIVAAHFRDEHDYNPQQGYSVQDGYDIAATAFAGNSTGSTSGCGLWGSDCSDFP